MSAKEGAPGLSTAPYLYSFEQPYTIFDRRQKALIVFIVSAIGSFSGFASNIYFPALPAVAHDLRVSVQLVNLSITSYLFLQAFSPSLWGPMSDTKGRRVAYCCTSLVYLVACIGLAETKHYATLIALRCLQSAGSGSTLAIGAGVIGDITTRAERGGYMGVFQAGLIVPVVVGPIIGGTLAGTLGWRSVFWFLTIYCTIVLGLSAVLLPETLRSIVGNGSTLTAKPIIRFPLNFYLKFTTTKWDSTSTLPQPASKRHVDIACPFRILFSKQAAPIIIVLAVYYAVWQMSITAMSALFAQRYRLDAMQIGLTFIANGVGSMIGTVVTGKVLDTDYRRLKSKYALEATIPDTEASGTGCCKASGTMDGFPLEKARLRLVPIFALTQCASILLFGWTVHCSDNVHISFPIISTFITGWTTISTQSICMTYLVDVFPDRSAAASASLNLVRCLFAAGGTAVIMPMIIGIGFGWAFTVCAVVQVFALVGVFIQWNSGGRWRKEAEKARVKNGQA